MAGQLSARQLTGLDDSHLVSLDCGHLLQPEVAHAFVALQADARTAGFELAAASSYRSFERQLQIWNGKASGVRPVHDDHGELVSLLSLPPTDRLHAILRFSAMPGTSRHHWGTDLDVFDAAAVAEGYEVQLTPQEVAPGGVFDALHCWLDERMAPDRSHGFYRPYAIDRGGVAPERWHLSYAPLSIICATGFSGELLQCCWDSEMGPDPLQLREEIDRNIEELIARYVTVPENWCSVR
jgi:LAS superfamily LD-carboxypeptidase LdcB